jgi:serine/threonine protein kinase
MGQVFLCEHIYMRKRVAVKVLPPAKAEQPAAVGRFYREARAAGALEHPNVVRTHDIDQDGNLHFIVMDYIDGPNLLDVVKRFGPMDIRRAMSYVRQTALGLDYAFRNAIIHRDIKPGNILIDRKGVARILDMGLARFLNDHGDQITLKYDDKIVLGTADYVAPEQIANSHTVDIRADIYALGATFYFLLAGHPPFPTGTVSQKLLWHRTKDPTPIRQIRPDVPDAIVVIVEKMMSKDPKARYQTPMQVVADLEPFLTEPVPLPPEEEMPALSTAATEGFQKEVPVEPPVESPASTASAAGSAAKVAGAAAVMAPPAVSPFGPTNTPWGKAPAPAPAPVHQKTPSSPLPGVNPGSRNFPKLPTDPQPAQVGVETVGGQEHTPPIKRDNPFLRTNPFGSEARALRAKKFPWALLVGGLVAVIALGVVLAVLTK